MKKKNRLAIILILITSMMIIGVTSAWYIHELKTDFDHAAEHMYEPLSRDLDPTVKEKAPSEENTLKPISVLLLGVDQRPGEQGRSDTLVVATLNPEEKNTYLLSIPRDTLTEIEGLERSDKINHAYAYGGVDMTLDTVERYLDIPIDYYSLVNMEGFMNVVDVFGGVEIEVNQRFDYGAFSFSPGQTVMDGEEALAYTRMRKDDPDGDIGRTRRQQQVLRALIDRGTSLQTLWNLDDVFAEVAQHVRTNVPPEELYGLQQEYMAATRQVETLRLEGESKRIDGIFYYIVPEEERLRVSEALRSQLGR
ncbi:LCP family protein [Caldalkalibacillus salinus]|uniref:LCP family glycopolymer transferase n=1 Tax=Caldalkalibacillus salinus TaxID=2803787 RepID=UPI0019219BAD|nr:LCP family protein [Caldalkalibacillus salinus]